MPFIYTMHVVILQTCISIHVHTQFSLTPDKIGLGFLADSLFYVIFAPIMGKLSDKTVKKLLN